MLGWWTVVTREGHESGPRIASWEASIGDVDWLTKLVKDGMAVQTRWSG